MRRTPPAGSFAVLRGVCRHPRARREELAEFQNERLRRIVTHAYRRVPYYRHLFDAHGVRPRDIRGTGDLGQIPITSKAELNALAMGAVVAQGVDPARLIAATTSGSSGEPFTIRRSWFEQNLLHTFRLRALHSFGLRPADRVAAVVRLRPVHRGDNKLLGRLLRAAGLFRRERIDLFLEPEEVLARLRKLEPDVVSGFPGVLDRLARQMDEQDRRGIRPRLLLSGAEVLTPDMRRRISDAFGAPVYDLYGSHEFNLLAWQCRETGELHTCDDALILEVIGSDGRPVESGERGEVVATALHSFAMPFIRYRLGDLVTRGGDQCACGQPFGTIRRIQGRMLDFFPLPGGRVIHPSEIVARLVDGVGAAIRQYELVQERRDRIVLRVVPAAAFSREMIPRIHASVLEVIGWEVEFAVELVAEIPPEANGKFRVSRSRVASEYDGLVWDAPTRAGCAAASGEGAVS
ncbi:MAG: phenylacetate--CoA ligase family protein [Longimicrobiaceae bacterium]